MKAWQCDMRYLLATCDFFCSSLSPWANAHVVPYLHLPVSIQNLHNSVLTFYWKLDASNFTCFLTLIEMELVGMNVGVKVRMLGAGV